MTLTRVWGGMSNKPPITPLELYNWVSEQLKQDDGLAAIYTQLDTYSVELDDDPLSLGPKRMQSKLSSLRENLNACETLLLNSTRDLQTARYQHRAKRLGLEMAMKALYASDVTVRAQKSVSDREATATNLLKDQWLEVQQAEQKVLDLEALYSVVKMKHSSLKDTQSRLREQIKLCDAQIRIGDQWGLGDVIDSVRKEGNQPSTLARELSISSMVAAGVANNITEELKAAWEGTDGIDWDAICEAIPTAIPEVAPTFTISNTALLEDILN